MLFIEIELLQGVLNQRHWDRSRLFASQRKDFQELRETRLMSFNEEEQSLWDIGSDIYRSYLPPTESLDTKFGRNVPVSLFSLHHVREFFTFGASIGKRTSSSI